MFERTSQSLEQPRPRSLRTVPLAAALHLALLGGLAAGSILVVEAIPEDLFRVPDIMEITVVVPPPQGTPDGGGGRESLAHEPEVPAPPPEETVQPRAVFDTLPAPPADVPDVAGTGETGDAGPGNGPGRFGAPDGVPGGLGPVVPGLPVPEPGPAPVDEGPIEVRGSVRAPRLLVKVQPVYPRLAISARVEGTVRLRAVIGPDGRVEELSVVSAANPLLIDAAREAVRRWVYAPALQGDRPVRVWFEAVVTFELD